MLFCNKQLVFLYHFQNKLSQGRCKAKRQTIKRLLTAGRPKCFLRDTLSIALTQNASIEFYTHSNVSIPCPNIHTHVTSCKRLEQTMGDNEVSFLICWEDLLRKQRKRVDTYAFLKFQHQQKNQSKLKTDLVLYTRDSFT